MRRSRVTCKDAWHHVVNRALNDEPILAEKGDKKYFLKRAKCNRYVSADNG